MVAIELPLDVYDHFVGCCDPESQETSILKRGIIIRRLKGNHYERIAEISCKPQKFGRTRFPLLKKPSPLEMIHKAITSGTRAVEVAPGGFGTGVLVCC